MVRVVKEDIQEINVRDGTPLYDILSGLKITDKVYIANSSDKYPDWKGSVEDVPFKFMNYKVSGVYNSEGYYMIHIYEG